MHIAVVETLEARRLLSGGVVVQGNPVTLATIIGQTPLAACPIGQNDTFVAYVKSGAVDGLIVDGAGHTVVPEFRISPQSQSVTQFGRMAATQDGHGDAALIYPVYGQSFSTDLYLVRVDPTGSIINQPVLVTHNAAPSTPAVAAGPNDSVGAVYATQPSQSSSTTTIFGQVFDASDASAFAAAQLSDPNNTGDTQILSNPAVVYNSSGGAFIAAWDIQNFNAQFITTLEAVKDRSFSPTGVLGPGSDVINEPLTATSNNVVGTPCFLPNGSGICVGVNNFGTAANNYPFGGSNLFFTPLNPNGTLAGTPTNILHTTAPNEFLVSPNSEQVAGDNIIFLQNGTYNGSGFQPSSLRDAILAANGQVIAENNPLFTGTFTGDPLPLPNGIIFSDFNAGTTTIFSQPTIFTPPPVTPGVFISGGTVLVQGSAGNDKIQVTLNSNSITVNENGKNKTIKDPKIINAIKDFVIVGGGGNDTVTLNAGTGGRVKARLKLNTLRVDVGAGRGRIIIGAGVHAALLVGGDGNDTIIAANANDSIQTGNGNDILVGGSGITTISSGNGNSTIFSVGKRDTITVGNGNNTIYAGAGDSIVTGSGTNTILGSPRATVSGTGRNTRKTLSAGQITKALNALLKRLHISV